ncbi:TPA: hypothetical protein ACIYBV_005091, partial [Escherichia coli]
FSSGAGRTSDGNGSHASTLKSPSYTKSVSWQHYQSGKNVGLVGQGSRIFIRTDDVPASIRVSVNKQQEKFCTITFDNVIDENKVYICR